VEDDRSGIEDVRSGIDVRRLGGASSDIPAMEVITEVILFAAGEFPREVGRLGDGPPRVVVGEGEVMPDLLPDRLRRKVGVEDLEVGVEDRPPGVLGLRDGEEGLIEGDEGLTAGEEDLGVGVEGLVPVGVVTLE
jgi:hypothetical protein